LAAELKINPLGVLTKAKKHPAVSRMTLSLPVVGVGARAHGADWKSKRKG
jgi:hypothetical protein